MPKRKISPYDALIMLNIHFSCSMMGSAQFKDLYTVSYCYSPLQYPRDLLITVLTSQSSLLGAPSQA